MGKIHIERVDIDEKERNEWLWADYNKNACKVTFDDGEELILSDSENELNSMIELLNKRLSDEYEEQNLKTKNPRA